jgi:predicted membrane-bound spermidine synthase
MSIEENTVLLVIDAMIGYVVIVEIAVVIKILTMRKNK